jgi:hypothetical protein
VSRYASANAATLTTPPDALSERITEANRVDGELESFLGTLISDYELMGPSGLKARTGLMEHRYDAI